jgi:RsiW-degrading membrane proteinase PrsW (M82 family)
MIYIYSLIALFIAWIWVDYYRLIDVFEREKLGYLILIFVCGGASVSIVYCIDELIITPAGFSLNGQLVHDFLFSVFGIGAVEEFAKIIPFILFYFVFKRQFNEPLDYLVYACTAALGFSAAENIMYLNDAGATIINARAILSTVGHMFNTALFAYGIILYKFRYQAKGKYVILLYFFYAALSHGFFDFWLIYKSMPAAGILVTLAYFFICISLFASILNNAINNSTMFTYKKVINSGKVMTRLLLYYGIVFIAQAVLLGVFKNIEYAMADFRASIYTSGFIICITCARLSRFRLVKDNWEELKPEFPFTYSGYLRIKGSPMNEAYINTYYEDYFYLHPLSAYNTTLGYSRLAFMESKFYIGNDIFYSIRVFEGDKFTPSERMIIKPKPNGERFSKTGDPIVGVMRITEESAPATPQLTKTIFLEWAVMHAVPLQPLSGMQNLH